MSLKEIVEESAKSFIPGYIFYDFGNVAQGRETQEEKMHALGIGAAVELAKLFPLGYAAVNAMQGNYAEAGEALQAATGAYPIASLLGKGMAAVGHHDNEYRQLSEREKMERKYPTDLSEIENRSIGHFSKTIGEYLEGLTSYSSMNGVRLKDTRRGLRTNVSPEKLHQRVEQAWEERKRIQDRVDGPPISQEERRQYQETKWEIRKLIKEKR